MGHLAWAPVFRPCNDPEFAIAIEKCWARIERLDIVSGADQSWV